jgi:tetratricopeptide (TPR) repeat protein
VTAASPAPASRWLYGPWRDLLFGCGLWYAAALGALAFVGAGLREHGGPLVVSFASLLVLTPHYGATLLRVYEQREDRRAYAYFAVHASLALLALFAVAVHVPAVAALVFTLYISWSPWHYSGQNFGVAAMFLRRRGIALEGAGRRWLHASFVLSYALTLLALHTGARVSDVAPVSTETAAVRFVSLDLDPRIGEPLFAAMAVAYAASVVGAASWLLRRGRAADALPALALIATQALWFSLPLALRRFGVRTGFEPWESSAGAYYFLWIATAHGLQYLWITAYYAGVGRGGAAAPAPRYFAKVLAAGALVWTLPALAFAPGLLGRLPYDGGLALLVASIVNLHHFVLDGAVWKLRDGRVARILLRPRGAPEAASAPRGRRLAPALWGVGAACLALLLASELQTDVLLRRAQAAGDYASLRAGLERLRWVGRDSPRWRVALAAGLERRGDLTGALREYQRALALEPHPNTWQQVALLQARRGDWPGAAAALEHAVALAPDHENAHFELGRALLASGRPAEAERAFARAVELNPARPINQTMRERAAAQAANAAARPPR